MQAVLQDAVRFFVTGEHLRNVLRGEWVALHDESGRPLEGIRGRVGAAALSCSGHEIGVDLIEMQPGTAFPTHTHPGDHILYILHGQGYVTIENSDRLVLEGDTIFIAAERPHGVKSSGADRPLVFLAFGHPHKHVGALDRMRQAGNG